MRVVMILMATRPEVIRMIDADIMIPSRMLNVRRSTLPSCNLEDHGGTPDAIQPVGAGRGRAP